MENAYEIVGDGSVWLFVKRYGVVRPLVTISECDLARVNEFPNTWRVRWDKRAKTHYAYGQITVNGKRKTIYLHRWIMDAERGDVVDHIDHNGLDNRRTMLRIVTTSGNARNRRASSEPLGDADGMTGWTYWPQNIEMAAFNPRNDETDDEAQSVHFSMGVSHVHGVPLGRFADYADELLVVWIGQRIVQGATDDEILRHMYQLGHERELAAAWIDYVRRTLNRPNVG